MGAASGARPRRSGRPDDRRTPAVEGAAARELRVETGQRNPAEGIRVFCPGGARPPRQVAVGFINDHRDVYGVEPICPVLQIAPSTYYRHHARQIDPTRRPARAHRDDGLRREIQRVWDEHFQVYGPRKVWKQLRREGVEVARCTVQRLMRAMGLVGATRGRAWVTTTRPGEGPRPADLVDRQFTATQPNQLWVADFTYVATWTGFAYVAFIVAAFRRRMVGWRGTSSLRTDFLLDALAQAISARSGDPLTGLVHHSARGSQYLSMHYPDRLADAGIAPSVGSRGDSYDN